MATQAGALPTGDSEVDASPWPPASQAWYAVFVFALALAVNFLDRVIISLLVPSIKKDLHLSDPQISLLMGPAFVLFYVLLGLPIARAVDSRNRKAIVSSGIAIWSLATALCGVVKSFGGFFACRVGVGVGEACNGPTTYSMLSDFFPKEKLTKAITFLQFGFSAGNGLALVLGGIVVAAVSTMPSFSLPGVGSLHPWQAAFFLCGAPGLVVALMMLTIKEPPRRGRAVMRDEAGRIVPQKAIPVGRVLKFMGANWAVYGPLFLGVAMRTMQSFGVTGWMATFFNRQYGWKLSQYGLYAGVLALVMAPLGLILGNWWVGRYYKRGMDDANMRVTFWVCLLTVPAPILAPLMPDPWVALLLNASTTFLSSAAIAAENAALQVVTPNQMRGQVTALFLFIFNAVGNGIGPVFVAFLEFHNESHLGYALALSALILGPLSVLVIGWGVKPYARAFARAKAWERGELVPEL